MGIIYYILMYLFFDTETNGLPHNWRAPVTDLTNWPRLVQIAWMLFDGNGQEIARNSHIVKPVGFTIPTAASDVHGISTEKALIEGIDLSIVLDEFLEQLKKANYIVAHNLSFDEKIVGAELLRNNYPNLLPQKTGICTMKQSTEYCALPGKYGYKWPKLNELHRKLFGYNFDNAHDAVADIRATAKCFWELRKRGIL